MAAAVVMVVLSITLFMLAGCGGKSSSPGGAVVTGPGATVTRPSTATPPSGLILGAVRDARLRSEGCRCTFGRALMSGRGAPNPVLLFIDMSSGDAVMNIDSGDVVMKPSPSCDRHQCTYRGSGVTAHVRLSAGDRCPAYYECETLDYEAQVRVESGGRQTDLMLTGSCGC
ncbi:MAG: hypothetical protein EOM91_01745 [Sphingobacteriia bacterium]|nr:hypothetical protein [Sphingobacteriia bacterium]